MLTSAIKLMMLCQIRNGVTYLNEFKAATQKKSIQTNLKNKVTNPNEPKTSKRIQ